MPRSKNPNSVEATQNAEDGGNGSVSAVVHEETPSFLRPGEAPRLAAPIREEPTVIRDPYADFDDDDGIDFD